MSEPGEGARKRALQRDVGYGHLDGCRIDEGDQLGGPMISSRNPAVSGHGAADPIIMLEEYIDQIGMKATRCI